jgi:hypothetical protein
MLAHTRQIEILDLLLAMKSWHDKNPFSGATEVALATRLVVANHFDNLFETLTGFFGRLGQYKVMVDVAVHPHNHPPDFLHQCSPSGPALASRPANLR